MKRFISFIAWGSILSAAFLIGLITYWYTYPYEPIKFNLFPVPIINKTVEVGSNLYYTLDYCKDTNALPEVSKAFVNGLVFYLPSTTGVRKHGCWTDTVGIRVPEELVPGKYHLEVIYTYKVNPLRDVSVSAYTEEFEIVKRQ